jgi:predicted nucleic acid-binding protein
LSTLLLDASVILAAFDRDDALHEPARALLGDSAVTLATLDLARYEVTNVAIRAWRTPKWVLPLLQAIEQISNDGGVLQSTNTLLARAAQLAEEHDLSAYDAAYVAAATQTGGTLVSCDIRDLVSKGLASLPATPFQQVNPREPHHRAAAGPAKARRGRPTAT